MKTKGLIKALTSNAIEDIENALNEAATTIYSQCVELCQENNITCIELDNEDIEENMDYGVTIDLGDDTTHYSYIKSVELINDHKELEPFVRVIAYNLQWGVEYQVPRYEIEGNIYNALSLKKFINDNI